MLNDFKAYQLAKRYYFLCKRLNFPEFLQGQLLRASSSVVLNIAEGSGKRTAPDQRNFYSIALGSLRECQALLDLEEVVDPEAADLSNQLGAILYTLSKDPTVKHSLTLSRKLADHRPN